MAVKLTPTEFYAALAKRTDLDTETVQKFWEVLDSFIVEELLRNGECSLPLLGNITLRQRGGKNAHGLTGKDMRDYAYTPYKINAVYFMLGVDMSSFNRRNSGSVTE